MEKGLGGIEKQKKKYDWNRVGMGREGDWRGEQKPNLEGSCGSQ